MPLLVLPPSLSLRKLIISLLLYRRLSGSLCIISLSVFLLLVAVQDKDGMQFASLPLLKSIYLDR